jgi:hypothetical protein
LLASSTFAAARVRLQIGHCGQFWIGALSVALQNPDAKMEKKFDDQMETLKNLVGVL